MGQGRKQTGYESLILMLHKLNRLAENPKSVFSIIFITAVLVRVAFIYLVTGPSPANLDVLGTLEGDEKGYVMLAKNIADGRDYGSDTGVWGSMWRTPGYPIFISSLFILFGHKLAIVQFAQVLLGALVCVLIYLVGQRIFNSTVGFVSALYFAFYPPHVHMSGRFLSENLLLPLILLIALAFLKMVRRPEWRHAIGCGFLLGIAALTRPEAAGIGIGVIALTPVVGSMDVKHMIHLNMVILVSMLFVLSPWLIRNYRISGHVVLATVGGEAFWGGNNEYTLNDPKWRGYWKPVNELREQFEFVMAGRNELERSRRRWHFGITFLKGHKSDVPRLAYYKLRRFYSFMLEDELQRIVMILSFGLLTPFIASGVIGTAVAFLRARSYGLILHVIVLYYNLIAVVFWGSNRFRLAIDPFLIMFGICAILAILSYLLSQYEGPIRQPREVSR